MGTSRPVVPANSSASDACTTVRAVNFMTLPSTGDKRGKRKKNGGARRRATAAPRATSKYELGVLPFGDTTAPKTSATRAPLPFRDLGYFLHEYLALCLDRGHIVPATVFLASSERRPCFTDVFTRQTFAAMHGCEMRPAIKGTDAQVEITRRGAHT